MNTLNRRTILRSAAAGATVYALLPKNPLWAQPSDTARSFESELTGSVIELLDDQWNFKSEFYGIAEEVDYTTERVMISGRTATVEVEFVQTSLDPEAYLTIVQDSYIENFVGFELADSGTTPDGAWFAGTAALSDLSINVFAEYQAGAYDDTDLVVILNSNSEDFLQNLPAAQEGILIGDLEPMMMIESSQVTALTFPVLAVAAPTPASGRTSRSTRGSTNTETTPRSNRRGQSQSTSTTSGSYVDDVRAHREEYLITFTDFVASVSVFGQDTSTEAQQAEAFDTIDRVAGEWLEYPARANQLNASPDLATLEDLYLTWADEIAEMGDLWFSAMQGTSTVDDLLDQLDIVNLADQALDTELSLHP